MVLAKFTRTRSQTSKARSLRHDATPAERILWTKLSRSQLGGFKFRRQHPVGPYVLDFFCPTLLLCVEVDGDQHGFEREIARDARRTAYLENKGIEVVRFSNHEVRENLTDVADAILHRANEIQQLQQLQSKVPSPWKGEG